MCWARSKFGGVRSATAAYYNNTSVFSPTEPVSFVSEGLRRTVHPRTNVERAGRGDSEHVGGVGVRDLQLLGREEVDGN